MPWTMDDVASKTKLASTAALKRLWVSVANQELARCKGPQEECEARAIRIANAAVRKAVSESMPDITEAGWTTAYMNDLPDGSFAYIEPGGSEDGQGKTTPRSLRHYPFKDAGGKVDLPHLRAALRYAAREIKRGGRGAGLAQKAMPKLKAAAKAAGVGQYAESLQVVEFREETMGLDNSAHVDREASMIRDVALLGANSKNDRTYLPDALTQAARLLDGIKAYADHPPEHDIDKVRGIREGLGKVQATRVDGSKVRGDFHVVPHAGWVLDLAERMPEMVGFSINGRGYTYQDDDGHTIVEAFERIRSVDLVSEPASTSSLYEGTQHDDEAGAAALTVRLKGVTDEQLSEYLGAQRPTVLQAIREEVRKGMGADDTIKELEEEKKTLEASKTDLEGKMKEKEEELETLRAAEARREKERLVAEKLEKAELPDEAKTEEFTEQLMVAPDEAAIDKWIADRVKVMKTKEATSAGSGEGTGGKATDEEVEEAFAG